MVCVQGFYANDEHYDLSDTKTKVFIDNSVLSTETGNANSKFTLTYISLASFLWDIGKQNTGARRLDRLFFILSLSFFFHFHLFCEPS